VFALRLSHVIFFAVFVLAVYGVQQFWFGRAWRAIGWLKNGRWRFGLRALLMGLAAVLVATLADPLVVRGAERLGLSGVRFGRLSLSSLMPGYKLFTFSRLWVITSSFAFVAVKAVGAIEWVANAVARLRLRLHLRLHPSAGTGVGAGGGEINASRRAFFHYAACAAGSVPFLAATYGFADERLRLTIERVDVGVANLPMELDGLRMAQLSDIHIGEYMPAREIARAVAMANGLQPDITVVTGDFISSESDPLEACITELGRLRAPLGVWGCNGNHEEYAGLADEAERLFREKGMRLLRGANAVVEHKGARFNLLGVDYQSDHWRSDELPGPKLREIEALVRRDMPNFLLSHNPNSFHRAAELGIELSLAGHTHGGQVKFEIVDHSVSPARLFTQFVAGLYHLPLYRPTDRLAMSGVVGGERAALYVNRGLGTIGFPVRLGSPPEITLLTLRRA
jgi:predicted MPP superfamily phosphohydrolase